MLAILPCLAHAHVFNHISDAPMHNNALVPTLVPCLGIHDIKVLLSMPNEPIVCKALSCLAHVSHATCLPWFDRCCGFMCHV